MPVKKYYKGNIETQTINNEAYRKVLFTTKQTQLVLMHLNAGEEIGSEVHPHVTQFFRFEKGTGVVTLGKSKLRVKDGDAVVVPAGTRHNVRATKDLKLYTLYSPPQHPDGLIQKTKEEADSSEESE